MWKPLFSWSHPSLLALTISPSPLSHGSLIPEDRCYDEDPLWIWMSQGLSCCVYFPIVGLCVSYHLQQEDASLICLSETLIYVYKRRLLGVILLLISFSRTIAFGFLLGSWHIHFQVLCHLSTVRHGFLLAERALNRIREWLVTPTTFVPLSHQHILLIVKYFPHRTCTKP